MTKNRAIAAIVGSAALAIGVPSALAHVDVVSSSPSAGSTVKSLPASVKVTFEDVIVKVGPVTLVGRDGKNHAVSAKIDPTKKARVLVTTKNPVAGRYTLSLTVTSADTHTVKRTIFFRVKG
jgi:methionine-rich copper-binding protein CopC